jgi:hypothetical protein
VTIKNISNPGFETGPGFLFYLINHFTHNDHHSMKKTHPQDHPNQEDKSGKPVYASPTKRNSSTTHRKEDDVNMPQGAESDYKEELLKSKKKVVKNSPDKKAK